MGDRGQKLLSVDRFGGVVVAAGVEAFLAVLGHGVRRQGDDRAGVAPAGAVAAWPRSRPSPASACPSGSRRTVRPPRGRPRRPRRQAARSRPPSRRRRPSSAASRSTADCPARPRPGGSGRAVRSCRRQPAPQSAGDRLADSWAAWIMRIPSSGPGSIVTLKVLPLPGAERTSMLPPRASARSLADAEAQSRAAELPRGRVVHLAERLGRASRLALRSCRCPCRSRRSRGAGDHCQR